MKKAQTQIKSLEKNIAALQSKLAKLKGQKGGKAAAPKKAAAKAPKKAAPVAPKKKVVSKKAAAAEAAKGTVLENVLDVIGKSRNGANIADLKAKTNLESRQLSNALYKLSKKGQIKTISRGVYVKA